MLVIVKIEIIFAMRFTLRKDNLSQSRGDDLVLFGKLQKRFVSRHGQHMLLLVVDRQTNLSFDRHMLLRREFVP